MNFSILIPSLELIKLFQESSPLDCILANESIPILVNVTSAWFIKNKQDIHLLHESITKGMLPFNLIVI